MLNVNVKTGEVSSLPDLPLPTAAQLKAAADAEATAKAKAELAKLDAQSIRDIRAYIAAKADAPQTLKDYEVAAIAERAKV